MPGDYDPKLMPSLTTTVGGAGHYSTNNCFYCSAPIPIDKFHYLAQSPKLPEIEKLFEILEGDIELLKEVLNGQTKNL